MYRREWLLVLASSLTQHRVCDPRRGQSVFAQARADQEDQRYMYRAIELARKAPHNPFGALLVNKAQGRILAEGWNQATRNPIWHGEIDAISKCANSDPDVTWAELTVYTTAEPCAMCQGAICWAGIRRVVYGASIPFLRSLGWRAIDIRAQEIARRAAFLTCTIVGGVLEGACNGLFRAARNTGAPLV